MGVWVHALAPRTGACDTAPRGDCPARGRGRSTTPASPGEPWAGGCHSRHRPPEYEVIRGWTRALLESSVLPPLTRRPPPIRRNPPTSILRASATAGAVRVAQRRIRSAAAGARRDGGAKAILPAIGDCGRFRQSGGWFCSARTVRLARRWRFSPAIPRLACRSSAENCARRSRLAPEWAANRNR